MPSVQSVERAFAILRCLSSGPAGVSQIADRVHLPKSTVSRLLSTLSDVGAVEQLGDGSAYRVGDAMIEVAAGALPGSNLVAIARPNLAELVVATGEDAGLSVLDGSDVYYLDQVSSDAPVRLRDWTGERVAAHCVSSGLVMLAHVPARLRDAAIPKTLPRFTDRTIVSPARLRKRLTEVATQESEWVYGEYADDINSVAAPIRDASGSVVAAVHVHGPSYRFPGEADPVKIADHVVAAGHRISERLAGRSDTAPFDVAIRG